MGRTVQPTTYAGIDPLYMLDQKTFSFHDADGVLVTLEARLKDGQFSISGRCGGSSGQCQDEIKPRTDKQRELLKLWKDYHLNSKTLPHNFKEHLEGLMCVIEYEEKEYKVIVTGKQIGRAHV